MGRITAVVVAHESASVEAAAAIGATSVTVDTSIDFDVDTASGETVLAVVAGSTDPFTITAAEDDEDTGIGTLTVAAPGLPVAVDVGDEIHLWDDQVGAATTTYRAAIDEEDGAFEAVFPSAPTVTADSLVGAEVDVDDEDYVDRVYGRGPVVDQRNILVPYASAYLPSDTSIPNGTLTRVTGWSIAGTGSKGITPSFTTPGLFQVLHDGLYVAVLTLRWANNSTGRRSMTPTWTTFLGSADGPAVGIAAAAVFGLTTQVVDSRRLSRGEGISVYAFQNSGAALDVLGGVEGMSKIVIYRVGS